MAFQEFMIAPVGAESVTRAVQLGSEVYQALKSVITEKHGASGEFPSLLTLCKKLLISTY